ncbi:hypothetical protein MKW98_021048 [Papaver atlanticum]|uniref:PGG domain-containing protein n=1 Tax=Papaver atlanticum TaxID=357466 RepID=A0AAD4T9Q6_9MAGN|nr:hypothetical protein MKW98_021048 [Papaver atlanticum]
MQVRTADLNKYLPLYHAAKEGDWGKVGARITISSDTALHIAALEGHFKFVKKLVEIMTPEQLGLQNFDGETALQGAVIAGNIESVKEILGKNPNLTCIPDNFNCLDQLSLQRYEKNFNPSPFSGDLGRRIIRSIIGCDFYDISHNMIEMYPELATEADPRGKGACALEMMATCNDFLSRNEHTFWDRMVYSLYFPSTTPAINSQGDMDPEKPLKCFSVPISARVCHQMGQVIRKVAKEIVPGRKVCTLKMKHEEAYFSATGILNTAAKFGTMEFVKECLETFPGLHWVKMGIAKRDIFYSAICERQEKMFTFLCNVPGYKRKMHATLDIYDSNILHMASWYETPSPFITTFPCIVLRVQRDLQWFKEVESFVLPAYKIQKNDKGDTPQEVFIQCHKGAFAEAEKWMKDTSQSCAFVSALVATVVFAATFTAPGGYFSDNDSNNRGIPVFLYKDSFVVFAAATAFMFGLGTLFVSVISLMVAFSATLCILLKRRFPWLPIPLSLVAAIPICLFLWTYVPLFTTMVHCAYERNIFCKIKQA